MTIATVVSITGQAWARDADGNLRELGVGDALQEGETLVTSDGGRAVLDFGDGLEPAAIAGGEEVVMTPDLASDQSPASEEASAQDGDVAALLAAIDEGEGDLLEGLDPTAAGGAGGAGDSGHDFVRLLRISEIVSPLAFNYEVNAPEGPDPVEFDPGFVAEEDDSPTVSTQDLNGDGYGVSESALPDGSGGGSLTASGAFQIDTGVDALELIEVQDASGVWIPISADGTAVQGAYGTLTVDTDGSWTYTLDDSTLAHDGDDQTGAADQVQDAFAVRVSDDDGDVSPEATLTIDVNDDGPTARDDSVTDDVAEDGSVDIDVFANDTAGADGVDLLTGISVTTAPAKGTVTYNGDGTFTYQATAGAEGADSFSYTITDADGDTSTATVSLSIAEDSTPTVATPDLNQDGDVVSESALADGSGGGTTTTSGQFQISTGGDALAQLEVQNADGSWVTIAADGTAVQGAYGTLTVDTDGSWSYTLDDNTLAHDGVDQTGAADQVQDAFAVRVSDDDGDVSPEATLTIDVNDDGPTARDDSVTDDVAEDGSVDIDVFANDTAGADGVDLLTGISVTTAPAKGTVTYNGDGTFTYQATAGAEGADSFSYTITDADGDTSTATVSLTVEADSEPQLQIDTDPDVEGVQAGPDSVSEAGLSGGSSDPNDASETTDGTFAIDAGNDSLAATDGLVIVDKNGAGIDVTGGGTVQGSYGTLTVTLADGVYSYSYTLDAAIDHADGAPDSESFAVTVTDQDGDKAQDTLTIAIADDAPSAVDDTITPNVAEDTALQINASTLIGNDTQGADGATVTGVSATSANGGTVSLSNGVVTYTPANGFEGTDSFSYTITDADGDPSTATVSLTVEADSEPQLQIDTDPDAAGVQAGPDSVSEAGLSGGSSDPNDASETTDGTFAIDAGNDSLAATDGLVIVDKNGAGIDVTGGGTVQGSYGTLTVTLADGVYSYSYTLDAAIDHADGAPDSESFAVTVTDQDGDKAQDTLTIAIADDAPSAVDDTITPNVAEDTALQINASTLIGNDTQGADGATVTGVSATSANGGTVSLSNGVVTYTPANGFEGTDSFSYTITDADGDPSTATVSLTVEADSEPQLQIDTDPDAAGVQAGPDSVSEAGLSGGSSDPNDASETTDGTFAIDAGNDSLAATDGLVIVDKNGAGIDVTGGGTVQGSYGTLTVTLADGVYSYSYTLDAAIDHADGAPDSESFAVTVTDQDGDKAQDTLTIAIADDAPSAVDDTITPNVAEDTALQINASTLIGNDTQGADGATVTGVSATSANGGTVSLSNGVVTYTPANGFEGTDSFSYTITDADGDPSTATVSLTVEADSEPQLQIDTDPDAAGVQAGPDSVSEAGLSGGSSDPNDASETTDGTFAIDAGNDSLAATDGLVIVDKNGAGIDVTGGGTVQGSYGTLTVTLADGVYSYSYTLDAAIDHADGAPDSESFAVTVTDQDGDKAQDTLTIAIADDAPSAVDDTITPNVAEDTALQINASTLIGNDTQGADGATVTGVSATSANGGTVSLSNGVVTYTPANGFEGTDSFSYTITDADGDPSTATVSLTVEADSEPQLQIDTDPDAAGVQAGPDSVSEAGLSGGSSDPNDASETTDGTFAIDAGNDSLAATDGLVIVDKNGAGIDVTGGGTVQGSYGTLTVTLADGVYSYSYTLDAAIDHADGAPDSESFAVTVTDQDGDKAQDTLTIAIADDAPSAVDDTITPNVAEDTALQINASTLIGNDTQGADGATVTGVSATSANGGTVSLSNGVVTYTPANGFEGTDSFSYTITDADGDPSTATVSLTVEADSEPQLQIDTDPDAAGVQAGPDSVSEAGLSGGSSDPNDASETTDGTFAIDAGNDSLAATDGLVIVDKNGAGIDVTGGGTVQGSYGTLTVTLADGVYSYSYTLDAAIDHADGAPDSESFAVTVTDQDGDKAQDTLTIAIADDAPSAVDDTITPNVAEDTALQINASTLIGNDTQGADGATVTGVSATSANGGTVSLSNGVVTYTPANGFEGTDSFSYTITDADGDPSTATVSLTVEADSEPQLQIDTDPDAAGVQAGPDSVSEAGLSGGSSDPNDASETTDGTFAIDAGNDSLAATDGLVIVDKNGAGIDVTGGGTVQGSYGTLTVTLADGVYSYSYTLDAAIDHADGAPDSESFAVTVTDQDGDKAQDTLTININDDSPTVSANDAVQLDDDALQGGNAGGIGDVDPDTANTTGTLGHSLGADGGSLAWLTNGAPSGFAYEASGNDLLIKQNGTTVITLTLDTATGAYTVTQNAAIDHASGDDENDLAFSVGYRVTDGDGDTAEGSLTINVDDDTPVELTTSSADLVDGYTAALNFASAAGADGVGDVTFAQSLNDEPALDSAGKSLYLDGEPLFYTVSADGHLLTAATEGGDVGFTVTLDPGTDSYTVAVEGLVLNGSLFSANPAGGTSGGNSPLYLINSEDGIEGNDVLVSSAANETVNTSTGSIGIGNAQSITSDDLVRFDFLLGLDKGSNNNAVWSGRLDVFSFKQSVLIVGGGQNPEASFDIYAVKVAGAASGDHPSSATNDVYLDLSVDDIRIYDASGGDVTASVTITRQGDAIRVEGVESGWSYELTTDTPFQAVEIVGADGKNFKLGDMKFSTAGTASGFDVDLGIVAEDGDGDSVSGSITLQSPEPSELEVGGNIQNALDGDAGNDVLIGDTGGSYTVITPGESYNISLIVDSSGSMRAGSGTAGKSRMQLAQEALKALAQQLVNHDGEINLQIIDFDTDSTSAVFTNITIDDLADIEAAINAMEAEGITNYEAAFNDASAWLGSQTNDYVNKAFFLTDGDPTAIVNFRFGAYAITTRGVMRDSIEAFEVLANTGDNGTQVEAIGIGSGVSADRLQFFDNTDVIGQEAYWDSPGAEAAAGEVTIVNTADELNAALQGGSSSDELAPVGNDTLIGDDGDDLLFGDAIAPVGQPEAGFGGVLDLVKDANGGVEPTEQQIIDFLHDNPEAYETPAGQGGDDLLIGGSGDDTLTGGLGADVFAWHLGDEGSSSTPAEDTVTDFTMGTFGTDANADKLDLSDLLSGMQDGEDLSSYIQSTDDGTNTTLHISTSGDMSSGDVSAADQIIQLQNVVTSVSDLQNNGQLDIE
ncbi:von Willebrand factor type A domain protein [Halomonas sp. THAF12]|uniref:retention module-containing protein n=1 Tax=Halomonas sp. THAF12 TaxID=2587849 RepID=UPI0012695B7D|nr:retention module-containing protein [Halomonas sp. THAF12]QFT85325.1 von Willebrand factor type A domain protein [Halomonas sp. THAF12]